jgi:hypothetical protein
MAKSLQYVKIFETLQAAKGPVPVSTIKALDGIVPPRLSTYLWEIKKNTSFAVKANRDGRSVVSYELVGSGTAPVAKVAKVATPKVAKPAKAVKSTKPVAKATKSNMAQDSIQSVMPAKSGPIDILDEIDTQIEDFEDRQFASDYIRGAV